MESTGARNVRREPRPPLFRRLWNSFMYAPIWRIAVPAMYANWHLYATPGTGYRSPVGMIAILLIILLYWRAYRPFEYYLDRKRKFATTPDRYYFDMTRAGTRRQAGRALIKDAPFYLALGAFMWLIALDSRCPEIVRLILLSGGAALGFWAIYCLFSGIGHLRTHRRLKRADTDEARQEGATRLG
jgi:hypothetical protein